MSQPTLPGVSPAAPEPWKVGRYLTAHPTGNFAGRPSWRLCIRRGDVLGRVTWEAEWSCYVLSDCAPGAVWSPDCLCAVAAFCEQVGRGA